MTAFYFYRNTLDSINLINRYKQLSICIGNVLYDAQQIPFV